MNRRWAHQAGHSWRKWGDPVFYGPDDRVSDPVVVRILFWAVCVDLGALAALLVTRS